MAEVLLEPNGFKPPAHVHPRQQQRVEVLDGSLGIQIGRRHTVVGVGARIVVPAGTPHRLWNAGDETAQIIVELTPALRFESLVETLAALAADGHTNAAGVPSPLHLAVIARAHFDTARLAFPPASVQRVLLSLAAPFGQAIGHRATYIADLRPPPG